MYKEIEVYSSQYISTCKDSSLCALGWSSRAKAIFSALCTLRVHCMLMRSSIVLQSIGRVPFFNVYVWVYA